MNDMNNATFPSPEHLAHAHKVAASKAAQMRERLKHSHPRLLGWPGLTPKNLIASEYRCWFEEELRELRQEVPGDDEVPYRLWMRAGSAVCPRCLTPADLSDSDTIREEANLVCHCCGRKLLNRHEEEQQAP